MPRILIVDDDTDIRRMLVRNLAGEYELLEADSGDQALELVNSTPVDLVLLDQLMPEKSGLDILLSIRAIRPYLPVMMLTAYGSTDLAVEFMRAGGTDFVEKPILHMDVFHLQIRRALASAADMQQEIARRQRAEAALRKREEQYRLLIDQASDGLFVTDAQGRCIEVNVCACTMLGYTREDLLHASFEALLAPTGSEHVVTVLRDPPSEVGVLHELTFIRHDGTHVPAEVSAKMLSDGRRQYFVRDITARRQAEVIRRRLEDHLRQAQKMEALGTLAGGIAHDFNNILTAILGYTELALRHTPQYSPTWSNMQEVYSAGLRARDLVKQILLFGKHAAPERRPLLLHLLIYETLRLLRPSLPSTITIRTRMQTTVGMVLADATQMKQVLLNLGSNAEYAMRRSGGTLEVVLDEAEVSASFAASHPELRPGPYLRLLVRDTGEGISPAVMARIFEPFFTTKSAEGTGMGLAIVHGIVTSHDGTILVESKPGEGTTFTIYLPRIEHHAVEHVKTALSLPACQARILFVDDEESIGTLAHDLLTEMGHEVAVYTDSMAALQAFQAAPKSFDLVITDQTMPRMTGSTLICEIRYLRPDIPTILCTGFSHTIDAENASEFGIDAFCLKPLTTRDLACTIQQVLELRGFPGLQGSETPQDIAC